MGQPSDVAKLSKHLTHFINTKEYISEFKSSLCVIAFILTRFTVVAVPMLDSAFWHLKHIAVITCPVLVGAGVPSSIQHDVLGLYDATSSTVRGIFTPPMERHTIPESNENCGSISKSAGKLDHHEQENDCYLVLLAIISRETTGAKAVICYSIRIPRIGMGILLTLVNDVCLDHLLFSLARKKLQIW